MALTLTHLRFGQEIMRHLRVSDVAAYYSGIIYPDSRILTGLPRIRTHGEDCPGNPFAPGLSDFERGWAAHILYDHLAHPHYFGLSPQSLSPEELVGDLRRSTWIYITAIKTVEDLQSFGLVAAEKFFQSLPIPASPRGESADLLRRYFDLQRKMYARRPGPAEYRALRSNFQIKPELMDGIAAVTARIQADNALLSKVAAIYQSILAVSREGHGGA